MISRSKSLLALTAVLLLPLAANADLVEGGCDGTLNTSVSCDLDTGLEWLDLTETLNLSVNQFLGNVGGWIDEGWRLATDYEIELLFLAAGAVDLYDDTPDNAPAINLLAQLLGSTYEDCTLDGIICSFGFGLDSYSGEIGQTIILGFPDSNDYVLANVDSHCCFDPDLQEEISGVMAYRNTRPVPEPGTLALFGAGILGIVFARSRRKA